MKKAMILAAGLGTRLRPWTLEHPKALVPVGGVPMLQRVIENLCSHGFDYIVVNVYHFAGQIYEFLASHEFGAEIVVSDESDELLDTGGGILKAAELLHIDEGPVLVHNVDILSTADLACLYDAHVKMGNDSTLLVSPRSSSRKLVFDSGMNLKGWHNIAEERYLPDGFRRGDTDNEYAFSGIHVAGAGLIEEMKREGRMGKFPLVDFLLSAKDSCGIKGFEDKGLRLIDIGKPATLSQAESLFAKE